MSQTTHENKQVNLKEILSQVQKVANRYLARYCDESNGSFEMLPKLCYGTFDDCGNIAG